MVKVSFQIVKDSLKNFTEDGCIRMSAALAYYTVFALPGLLIIVISIAGLVFETQSVEDEVVLQARALLGIEASRIIQTVIDHALSQTQNISLATLLGVLGLLFGATGAFTELQSALNTIWKVRPDPQKGNIRLYIRKRLLSFGMILSIGFMLLVSLVMSTLISMLNRQLHLLLPDAISATLIQITQFLLSFVVITFLFAAIFKVLPDAIMKWKDVGKGAIATAFTFVIGKELIGFYLGNSNVGSAYGAASSLTVLLIWVYFSAVLILWGAEFTRAWIQHSGRQIKPGKGAIPVSS